MGEISELIYEGIMCSWCGVCFVKAHGEPVVCDSCGADTSNEELERLHLKRACYDELGANDD